jgi:hypothetical protein
MTLFLVRDLFRDFEKLINESISDQYFVPLIKLIQSIRTRLSVVDEYDENLNDYFFLSAVINFIDMSLIVITTSSEEKVTLKELGAVLFEKAKEVSSDLAIDYPHINWADCINSNVTFLSDGVTKWLDDLRQKAKNRTDR